MILMLKLASVIPQDESLLYQLYASIRREEFSLLGLSELQMQALLHMQYDAQKNAYHVQCPQAKYELIYYEALPIGRMITDIQSQGIHLVDIALLPDYREKGYGTQLIKSLQSFAIEKQLSVMLHVLQGNPAQRLYERCGFYVTGEVIPYVAMKWEKS